MISHPGARQFSVGTKISPPVSPRGVWAMVERLEAVEEGRAGFGYSASGHPTVPRHLRT